MKVLINPMLGWGNDPNVEVRGIKYNRDPNWMYNKGKDGIYWYQDVTTGTTDYFFHDGELEKVDPLRDSEWQTKQNYGGYGNRVFKINTVGWGIVHVRGPWSGGDYCANKHLPFPATCVGYHEGLKYSLGTSCGLAGHMMISKINKLLEEQKSAWRVIETKGPHEENLKRPDENDHYWVTCAWNGKTKKKFQSPIGEELTKEELIKLQKEYCEQSGFPFRESPLGNY